MIDLDLCVANQKLRNRLGQIGYFYKKYTNVSKYPYWVCFNGLQYNVNQNGHYFMDCSEDDMDVVEILNKFE